MLEESRRRSSVGRQQSECAEKASMRTPPGSESGACAYRGSSGTWENLLSPCQIAGSKVYRLTKRPGLRGWLSAPGGVLVGKTKKRKRAGYRKASLKNERFEKGNEVVLAEHSTDDESRKALIEKVGNRDPMDPL